MRDETDERNCWNPLSGLRPSKSNPLECTFQCFSYAWTRHWVHLTFGIFMMFHDSRLNYPPRSWRSVNWRLYVIGISKHKIVLMWPWAARAPIRVELNQQVFCGQQKVTVKYHLDRSRVGRMTARKPVFYLQ